jgi:hypothetical protein
MTGSGRRRYRFFWLRLLWIRERTGSVTTPIVAHNALNVTGSPFRDFSDASARRSAPSRRRAYFPGFFSTNP